MRAHLAKWLPEHADTLALLDGDATVVRSIVLVESTVEPTGFVARWMGRTVSERALAMVTPALLVRVIRLDAQAPICAVLLRDGLELQRYESTPMFAMREDHGLHLTGVTPGAAQRGTHFLGLGPEPASEAFVAALSR
ncbi:MAG: hypothetical protein EP330_03130 [Deltaproteobacteria bacterium]|nr:MAG: hypothetical protein EP330_03130 [Deltaproteobacteria bacterium]